jgi:uncharacterized protein (TIGR03118 family)
MQNTVRRYLSLAACCAFTLTLWSAAAAQSYTVSALTSDLAGKANHTDPLLKNPWGLAYAPTGAFWVSDEASGWSTLYDGSGVVQSLKVFIPSASGSGSGTPTGIVYNGSSEFQIRTWTSAFLFATLDGTISGWSTFEPTTALIGAKQAGAVYTGLAITSHPSGNFLYAADNANNKVDVYDGRFNLVNSFTDPIVPAGYAPFGIQDINGQVYVTFASQTGGSNGLIDIFTESGVLVKHLAHGSPLNQAWGLAMAPSNFGSLSGMLLVSNNLPAGTINAFDPNTGKFVGTIKNSAGKNIQIPGLWGIEFGGGAALNGKTNQLFLTAGPNNTDGYFGVINAN